MQSSFWSLVFSNLAILSTPFIHPWGNKSGKASLFLAYHFRKPSVVNCHTLFWRLSVYQQLLSKQQHESEYPLVRVRNLQFLPLCKTMKANWSCSFILKSHLSLGRFCRESLQVGIEAVWAANNLSTLITVILGNLVVWKFGDWTLNAPIVMSQNVQHSCEALPWKQLRETVYLF